MLIQLHHFADLSQQRNLLRVQEPQEERLALSPVGLIINTTTGAVTPSTSTAGTYTVTYDSCIWRLCTIYNNNFALPLLLHRSATISYAGSFCSSNSTAQAVTRTGTAGGTFSSTSGLTIDANTGAITPSTSTAGTYTVTYTIPASGGCAAFSTTASVIITQVPAATIAYSASSFCRSVAPAQPITRTGTPGGTFSSSPAGLIINTTTGAVTPSTSTAGTYTTTLTIPASGGCAAYTTTTSVTITAVPTATISYAGPFCITVSAPQSVSLSGSGSYAGGTFSAPGGLSINPSTGQITPSLSSAGTYAVTYTSPASGGCSGVTATASVTISALPSATIAYLIFTPYCATGGTAAVTRTGTAQEEFTRQQQVRQLIVARV